MADLYSAYTSGLESPARKAAAVTPHDDNELDPIPRALYVGTAGNLAAVLADDIDPVTFVNVQGWLRVRAKKVMATNTTATNIVAVT